MGSPWASDFGGNAGAVTKFNGRTGDIVPAAGDYDEKQISPDYTSFSNANKTVSKDHREVAQIGTMSAQRTVTLPAASDCAAGVKIYLVDASGTVTVTNNIKVIPAGTDTINATTEEIIYEAFGERWFMSDGVSNWSVNGGELSQSTTLVSGRVALSGGSNLITDSDNLMYAPDLTTGGLLVANTTNSSSPISGSGIFSGGVGIAKALWVGGLAKIAGVFTAQNTTDASSSTVGGSIISGGLALAKKLIAGGSIKTIDTTDSSSVSTGSGVFDGGVGIAKALFVGGLANLGGAVYVKKTEVTSAAGTTALAATDFFVVVVGSTTETLTLPAAGDGRGLIIKNRSTGIVTVNRAGSDTIDGGTSITLSSGASVTLIANSTDWTIN